jgi:hypothetical protein
VADRPDWKALEATAEQLISEATEHGMTLRLVGSLGVRLHCEPMRRALDHVKRLPKDIDIVCRRRDGTRLQKHLEERGFEVDRDLLIAMEGHRYAFHHPQRALEIDVFVDRLDFCHTIDMRRRLGEHPLTVSVEDLLLHKLQVVEPTEGDLIDLNALLRIHDVADGSNDPEIMDAQYIARLLAADWGFWRTATGNLERLRQMADNDAVRHPINRLLEFIELHPKTVKWRLRARIGDRLQWWQDVDEREATY